MAAVRHMTGAAGTTLMVGQAVQLVGVVGAMVCRVLAARAGYARERRSG